MSERSAREYDQRRIRPKARRPASYTDEDVERVAYPIFVGVARAPWTRREDDQPCPVKDITKNECRNIARAALDAYLGGGA